MSPTKITAKPGFRDKAAASVRTFSFTLAARAFPSIKVAAILPLLLVFLLGLEFFRFILCNRLWGVLHNGLCRFGLRCRLERRRGRSSSRTYSPIPTTADRMPSIWEERMPVPKKYRLSVRIPSITARPRPYQIT